MKNILLPTDFSENSLNAIDYAMHFFEHWECDFYILNVQKVSEYITDDLMTASPMASLYADIAADNKKLINQLVEKLDKQYEVQSYTFHGVFDYDDFVSSVKQVVQFHAIDLIIMGTNGATDAKEVIFGSNTLQVLRNIDCPTLTIPHHYSYTGIKRALFSTDQQEGFSIHDIQVFKEILSIHPCELQVLELKEGGKTISKQDDNQYIRGLFKEHPYTYFCLQTIPSLIAVNTATQLLKVDIHAVFVAKESFLKRLLFGSETAQLAYSTIIPLLFLHK
jgi:nucleotide-binding universal stress UspA family protein